METKLVLSRRTKDDGDFGNDLVIRGNLGRDPEMSYTPSGQAYTKLSVAVWAGKQKTMWITVSVWGDLAEACAAQLLWEGKGEKSPYVQVKGYLTENTWKGVKYRDMTGNHVTILEHQPDVPAVEVTEVKSEVPF